MKIFAFQKKSVYIYKSKPFQSKNPLMQKQFQSPQSTHFENYALNNAQMNVFQNPNMSSAVLPIADPHVDKCTITGPFKNIPTEDTKIESTYTLTTSFDKIILHSNDMYKITIYDMMGAKIYEEPANNYIQINTNSLSSGLYIIKISNNINSTIESVKYIK